MTERLVFVRLIGTEEDGYNRYEFIFSDNIEHCKIENDDSTCCLTDDIKSVSIGNELKKYVVKTKIEFDLLQDNCCFTYRHGEVGIVAIAIENIDAYDEYPSDGRLVFMYGEPYDEVEMKLALKNILIV